MYSHCQPHVIHTQLTASTSPKRVTHRHPVAHRPPGAEFLIVVDQIQMSFWPNKEVPRRIHLETHPEVPHEMINGDVVLAGIEIAGLKWLVKTYSLGPNPTQ